MTIPLAIQYGNLEGKYFTQWRIDMLEELLQEVASQHGDNPPTMPSNVRIWYDAEMDFHRMSFDANGNQVEVRLYKVWSSKINGANGWIGCPKYHTGRFARHLRDEIRADIKTRKGWINETKNKH